jgi:AbrB family looped-hinge helix DNA binding protein
MEGVLIMIASSKITSKGQITLPLRIRNKAKLAVGDVVNFELKNGYVQ